MFRKLFLLVAIVLTLGACNKAHKCTYDECSQQAPASEIQSVQSYLNAQGITNAVQHCSGLFYVIDNAGSGSQPDACSTVSVNYTGALTNGSVFGQGNFTSDLEGLIAGWRNGLPKLHQGGRIRLFIPPSLGYGAQPNGPIPANSILIFTIDLNAVL